MNQSVISRAMQSLAIGLFCLGLIGAATASQNTSEASEADPAAEQAHRTSPGQQQAMAQLRVDNLLIPYNTFALYLKPGETRQFDLVLTQPGDQYEWLAEDGESERIGPNRWRWTAPETPGLYSVVMTDPAQQEPIQLSIFVKRPLAERQGQHLNGYIIGDYPSKPLRGNPRYNPPQHLVEVTTENQDTLVSPNFRIRQFLTKQGGDWPRYVLLDERLLLKLELILAKVRAEGWDAETLFIMSGYRTPHYNKAIGNVPYSRHVYGDAADIFVDTDGSGRMDDLNGDGQESFADAEVLAGWIDELASDPYYAPLIGGIGRYGPKPHRGPFVHIDTRGAAARWDAR